jgi:outer membrane protein TolC
MEAQPTALEMRQAEIDAYTANVNTYTNLLATLDGDWDEDLAH